MSSTITQRMVFVDDEPQVLRLLQLALRPMAGQWEAAFFSRGEDALTYLAEHPVDVVISDMRMPGMNGAQLLNEVRKRHPQTVRLILSGHAQEDLVMQCLGSTHQFLAKPIDVAQLRATLRCIQEVTARLSNPDLRRLATRLDALPSIPQVYLQIMEALQSPECSVQQISEILSADPALTAKILQLVNSAFFGFARKVSSVEEGVQLLGVGIIRSLALMAQVFSAFDASTFQTLGLDRIWNHSLRTGWLAKRILEIESDDPGQAEQALTAGLLHDLGKLMLASSLPKEYREIVRAVESRKEPLHVVERHAFNATHAEVGGHLLGIWGLPAPVVEAVALHHDPDSSPSQHFSTLTAVHAANLLACQGDPPDLLSFQKRLGEGYLSRIGMEDHAEIWHELAFE
jgi:HD-like signal output (HDOD) protein